MIFPATNFDNSNKVKFLSQSEGLFSDVKSDFKIRETAISYDVFEAGDSKSVAIYSVIWIRNESIKELSSKQKFF